MVTSKRKRPTKKVLKKKPALKKTRKQRVNRWQTFLKTEGQRVQRKIAELQPAHWLMLSTIGLAIFFSGILFYLYSQTILSFKVSPVVVAPAHLRNAYPTTISIKKTNTNLEIIPGNVEDGIWQTSEDKAVFLENSSRPSEGGNIIIYGHNKKNVLSSLHSIKVGDTISLTTANNGSFEYRVQDVKVVDPSAIDEVMPTDHEVLTVYTCTGFLDSKRLVVKAYPTQVSSL